MSVVNYLNNGSTLVMLIGTSMQLASFMSLQDNPVITAIPDLPQFSSTFDGLLFAWIAFVLAISARVIDMVQNGYEQHTDAFATIFYSSLKPNDELGPLTLDETKNPLGSPTLSNAKTSIVLFFLVLTTVFTYLGITTDCPLFTSCNSTSATDSSEHFTYYEQVLSHTVFLLIAVHTIFGFVALSGSPAAAISTRELVRVVVSTAVLVLLATLLTAHSLSMLGLGLAAYIVVDAFGRDFL